MSIANSFVGSTALSWRVAPDRPRHWADQRRISHTRESRRRRAGRRSCAIMRMVSLRWTCLSFRQSLFDCCGLLIMGHGRRQLARRHITANGGLESQSTDCSLWLGADPGQHPGQRLRCEPDPQDAPSVSMVRKPLCPKRLFERHYRVCRAFCGRDTVHFQETAVISPCGASVPLSDRLLSTLPQENGLLFPGEREGKPLSNMAMLQTLKRLGRIDITIYGFRSTFRDWAAEQTSFPNHVVEMALAHTIGNKVEAPIAEVTCSRSVLDSCWHGQSTRRGSTRLQIK
jgi:hypothetical protein